MTGFRVTKSRKPANKYNRQGEEGAGREGRERERERERERQRQRQRETESERESCLLVAYTSQQHAIYLRDGSARKILRAATLR